jgi:U3 small nucleolar RNA-associated protein 18
MDEIDYEASDNASSDSDSDEGDSSDDDQSSYLQKAAWKDDDDSRLEISLSSANRLRKLRKNDEENTISGAEYERRLRKQ